MIPYLRCLRHRDVPSPDNVTVCRCFDTDSRHGYSFKNPVLGRLDGPGLDGDASWQARRHSLPALPRRNRRALQRIWQVPITMHYGPWKSVSGELVLVWAKCEFGLYSTYTCTVHTSYDFQDLMVYRIFGFQIVTKHSWNRGLQGIDKHLIQNLCSYNALIQNSHAHSVHVEQCHCGGWPAACHSCLCFCGCSAVCYSCVCLMLLLCAKALLTDLVIDNHQSRFLFCSSCTLIVNSLPVVQ